MRIIFISTFFLLIFIIGCSKPIIEYDEAGIAIVNCDNFCDNAKIEDPNYFGSEIVSSECRDRPDLIEGEQKEGSLAAYPHCDSNKNLICGCILSNGEWKTG